jgi:hypothetical protein
MASPRRTVCRTIGFGWRRRNSDAFHAADGYNGGIDV